MTSLLLTVDHTWYVIYYYKGLLTLTTVNNSFNILFNNLKELETRTNKISEILIFNQ